MTIATLTLVHTYNGDSAATQFIDCAALDTDLGNIVAAINGMAVTYSVTLKTDGTLQDDSVHAGTLADDALALIQEMQGTGDAIPLATLTAEGDLLVGGVDGAPEALPAGNEGDHLEIVSGVPAYVPDPHPITISTSDPPSDLADGAIWLKFTP